MHFDRPLSRFDPPDAFCVVECSLQRNTHLVCLGERVVDLLLCSLVDMSLDDRLEPAELERDVGKLGSERGKEILGVALLWNGTPCGRELLINLSFEQQQPAPLDQQIARDFRRRVLGRRERTVLEFLHLLAKNSLRPLTLPLAAAASLIRVCI